MCAFMYTLTGGGGPGDGRRGGGRGDAESVLLHSDKGISPANAVSVMK